MGYHERAEAGELTQDEARRRAAARIKHMRYGRDGRDYFWINDTEPRMIMHPYMEELVGENVRGVRDFSPEGKAIFDEFQRAAQSPAGGGYVSYTWQYYGEDERSGEKISYVIAFEPWDWVIGTGVYLGDLHGQIGAILRRMGVTTLAIVLILTALLLLVLGQGMRIIGQHARARQQLETTEHEHHELLNALNVGVLRSYVREHGWFLAVNNSMVDILGYEDREELMQARLVDLWVDPSKRDEFLTLLEERGRISDMELALTKRDGSPVWVKCSAIGHRDKDGRIREMDGIVEDVTERRFRQQELERYREQLEELVEERTDELRRAQNDLVRAEQMALLGRLTGSISHEMRNPLGVIRSSVFYMGEKLADGAPEGVHRALQRVERSVKRCDWIVAQLMEYAGAENPVRIPTRVNPWLAGVLEDYQFPAELSALEVRRDVQADDQVAMDSHKMARAVGALLDNCRDAFLGIGVDDEWEENSEDPVVVVLVRRHPGQDALVDIIVEDNGPGMPPDVHERVFEPLYSTKGFGVGLGLSICAQIVDNHGGEVRVDTKPGEGTTVTLTMPVFQPE
jgi:PAS domain S-box-containing protein